MLPHVTAQILHPTATEMLRILKERFVALPAGQRIEVPQVAQTSLLPHAHKPPPEPFILAERNSHTAGHAL